MYSTGVPTVVTREDVMRCTYLLKLFKDATKMVSLEDGI